MTQEQKAKAYDEAIDKVAYFIKKHIGFGCMIHPNSSEAKELFNIFPQLKENEDERIRKAIITLLNTTIKGKKLYSIADTTRSEMLAWLEKQSAPQVRTGLEWGNTIDDACDKRYAEDYADGEYCHEQSFKWGFQEGVEWLERQGKQKPAEEYNITGIGSKNAQGKLGEMIKNLKPVNEVLEQKHVDKVEPKFKVGDWVVTSYGMVNQVIAVDEDGDGFTLDDDTYLSGFWKDNFHLWTIQDAKDGDVLYSHCCKLLWIYKDEKTCHVGFNLNYNSGSIVINKPICIPTDVQPATKERRELLSQKMKKAGFTFDFEKKELKKIEKNLAWSEEDENMCLDLIQYFVDGYGLEHNLAYIVDWLKSLKERVGCAIHFTATKAWSEEDEAHLDSIIKRLEEMCKPLSPFAVIRCSINGDKNWLKSLKERYTWKPSDEQMRALRLASQNDILANTTILQGLYNDIKKLN